MCRKCHTIKLVLMMHLDEISFINPENKKGHGGGCPVHKM